MTATVVREAPAELDRLALTVKTPDGVLHRWADDEAQVEDVPLDLEIASSIPGGDSDLSCELLRDMRRRASDLGNYNEVSAYGPGLERIWRGYLVHTPDTSRSVSPAAI